MSEFTLKKDKMPAVVALIIMAAIIGLIAYPKYRDAQTGELQYKTANNKLADGLYEEAIEDLNDSLSLDPEHVGAHLTMAITLIQLKRNDEAFEWFDRTLALDPENAAAYANRGILNDRLGNYEQALEDYKRALIIDGEIAEGPGVLTRFLKKIDKKPPTIYDRAVYIQEQLKLPPEERVLSMPELDEQQQMYKIKK